MFFLTTHTHTDKNYTNIYKQVLKGSEAFYDKKGERLNITIEVTLSI